jgi:hypothetical protein
MGANVRRGLFLYNRLLLLSHFKMVSNNMIHRLFYDNCVTFIIYQRSLGNNLINQPTLL